MSLGEVTQISEGIYAYLQPDGSWYLNNTGFLIGPDVRTGVISVDATSTERRTRAYLDAIASVARLPVRTLVNTHHHGDHSHGNYLRSVQDLAREAQAAGLTPLQAAREADLGKFKDLLDAERLVGNLYRAYRELDGGPPGAPGAPVDLDLGLALGDMVAYHGGPLTCHA